MVRAKAVVGVTGLRPWAAPCPAWAWERVQQGRRGGRGAQGEPRCTSPCWSPHYCKPACHQARRQHAVCLLLPGSSPDARAPQTGPQASQSPRSEWPAGQRVPAQAHHIGWDGLPGMQPLCAALQGDPSFLGCADQLLAWSDRPAAPPQQPGSPTERPWPTAWWSGSAR